jgi:tetratricopeptide (TPR) repeat protein
MANQGWLWPTLKHSFFSDLEERLPALGGCDVVLFSGDLTQKGTRQDFDRLDEIVGELWDRLRKVGFNPGLACVPGNHDLQRPSNSAPTTIALETWWSGTTVRDVFWDEAGTLYREAVQASFEEYTSWVKRLEGRAINFFSDVTGIMPGDFSAQRTINNLRLGIVGLNSAWLQLGTGAYQGKLHIDTRQLLALTRNDPNKWCGENDFNIIMTHHPLNWLSTSSVSDWNSEIRPGARFEAHLYGHMHEPESALISNSGGAPKFSLQAASIFGLEKIGDSTFQRIHGFSYFEASCGQEGPVIKVWPRILWTEKDGSRRVKADPNFGLANDGSFSTFFSTNTNRHTLTSNSDVLIDSFLNKVEDTENLLVRISNELPLSPQHNVVRLVERETTLAVLTEGKVIWIISEWGMGVEGFISSIRTAQGRVSNPFFRVNLDNMNSRDTLPGFIYRELGCRIQRFSDILSDAGPSYLLIDNIPFVNISTNLTNKQVDLETVISAVSEYCPNLTVFLRTRRSIKDLKYPTVELKPLDEVDIQSYVKSHRYFSPGLVTSESVRTLYKHTEGIPARLESALLDLQIVALDELVNSESQIGVDLGQTSVAPMGIVRAVSDIAVSDNPVEERAFSLLKALAVFPHGEQLAKIRRFHGPIPFHAQHARQLIENALVEAVGSNELNNPPFMPEGKTLVVPRPIREYLREIVAPSELRELNEKAARLYFGDRWQAGTTKFSTAHRFGEPLAKASDISNASTLIVRLLRESVDQDDQHRIGVVLDVSHRFLSRLHGGSHHRAVVELAADLIVIVPNEGFEERHAVLAYHLGRSQRMIGRLDDAVEMLESVRVSPFLSGVRQSLLLSLALAYQSKSDIEKARLAATEAIGLGEQTNAGLQAKSIVIECEPASAERALLLEAHEKECRKNKAYVAANNIALERVDSIEITEPKSALNLLQEVIENARIERDGYNLYRAVAKLGRIRNRLRLPFTASERAYLIEAYQFMYNERLESTFDSAHEALWGMFEREGDQDNLLRLFRKSSFIWRLRGDENRENGLLVRLANVIGEAMAFDLRTVSREVAYFVVRKARAAGLVSG